MDTNIIQHHFVICIVKYTHLCIRHRVQTSTIRKENHSEKNDENFKNIQGNPPRVMALWYKPYLAPQSSKVQTYWWASESSIVSFATEP
jgi:hypothetical protein